MSKEILAGALTVSAILLTALLLVTLMSPDQTAYAQGSATRAGYFVACTATRTVGRDLLWVANVNTQEMIVCERQSNGRINVLDIVDLRAVFGN